MNDEDLHVEIAVRRIHGRVYVDRNDLLALLRALIMKGKGLGDALVIVEAMSADVDKAINI